MTAESALADGPEKDGTVDNEVTTVEDAVRVIVVRSGGSYRVASVSGRAGSGSAQQGCDWSLVFAPDLDDVPYGTSAGPMPHADARFALLLCNGEVVRPIWVAPDDVIDLDAAAAAEAERYLEDVLVPDVSLGVNPATTGLVGLPSWFWVEGFDGSITAAPISVFGVTIDVRMTSASVTWDFGDGTREAGDLGVAYPAESSVQHTYATDGTFDVSATIDLVPEYRVDGGPWITLAGLQAQAAAEHAVEERQAVITSS